MDNKAPKAYKLDKKAREVEANKQKQRKDTSQPQEVGGREAGLEPTRYGDWELKGKCVDF